MERERRERRREEREEERRDPFCLLLFCGNKELDCFPIRKAKAFALRFPDLDSEKCKANFF